MARKQEDLPAIEGDGVAPKRIPSVEKAADKYVEIRDKRMELTEKEVAAKAVLLNAMHEAGVTVYTYNDYKVVIESGQEKVKVRTVDQETPEEDED